MVTAIFLWYPGDHICKEPQALGVQWAEVNRWQIVCGPEPKEPTNISPTITLLCDTGPIVLPRTQSFRAWFLLSLLIRLGSEKPQIGNSGICTLGHTQHSAIWLLQEQAGLCHLSDSLRSHSAINLPPAMQSNAFGSFFIFVPLYPQPDTRCQSNSHSVGKKQEPTCQQNSWFLWAT